MLNEDIALAQKIVSNSFNPVQKEFYHQNSFIYKVTNEMVNYYQDYLKDRNKILSITASGDQVLNSILEGSKYIDVCDISRFPNYFLKLKIAAILSLTREEYLNFFINGTSYDNEFSDLYFEKLKDNLSKEDRIFWNSLFNFFDGSEIYNSMLFSHEVFNLESVLEKNKFLEENNYLKLRKQLEDVSINYMVGSIHDVVKTLKEPYDLVNLSSIIYYDESRSVENYKKLLKAIPLSDNGIILTYLYTLRDELKNMFSENNYTFDEFNNSKEGVMVYQVRG